MPGQEHQQRATEAPAAPLAEEALAPSSARSDAALADIDDVLDEIDGVLEADAEEFVAGFVQRGGQ